MEGQIVPEEIHKISYQERLVYAYFSLDKQVGLRTVFSLAVSRSFLWHPPEWETTAIFGRVSSGNFRQDYGYMRTSQHARLRESTVGECSWTNVLNWRPRRQPGRGNRRSVHAGRENRRKTILLLRTAEIGNDLTLCTTVLSQSFSLRSCVGELEPVIVQADSQRKCPIFAFYPLHAQLVKYLMHEHQTNWQHPLLCGCENQANFRTRAACSPPHRRDLYSPASRVSDRKAIWIREQANDQDFALLHGVIGSQELPRRCLPLGGC